jgi:hypothetical protein
MTAAALRLRRRKALLAALALNRGEVDPGRLARLLRECGPSGADAAASKPA